MIKRMVEISRRPAHLSVKHNQLELNFRDGEQETARVPCEDLGVLVVDQPQVTYSHRALAALMESGATVVLCGGNHLPTGLLLPLPDHSEVVHRIHTQINISKPLRKQLWKKLVVAKVRAQTLNIPAQSPEARKLKTLARRVRSGDPSNIEAQAAKVYWRVWLGPDKPFRRDTDGDGVNGLLNYGYAVVRAAVGRAIMGAGLLPMFGLNHSNRSNAFCLADDLLEPLRPLVEARVPRLVDEGCEQVNPKTKAELISVLNQSVNCDDKISPLQIAIQRMAYSLQKAYKQDSPERLKIPVATQV